MRAVGLVDAGIEGQCVDAEAGDLTLAGQELRGLRREPREVEGVMVDAPATRPVPLPSLVKPIAPGGAPNVLRIGGEGGPARLVCGAFRFGPSRRHPLLAVLPPAILVHGKAGRPAPWLEGILSFFGEEARRDQPGAETVISRLTDVIFVQAVRAWMDSQPETEDGRLGALRDPQVGRSLALVHRRPEREWTVAELGAEVTSPRPPSARRSGGSGASRPASIAVVRRPLRPRSRRWM